MTKGCTEVRPPVQQAARFHSRFESLWPVEAPVPCGTPAAPIADPCATLSGLAALQGFTPYLGGGVVLGQFSLSVQSPEGHEVIGTVSGRVYLELHATAGARYCLPNGLACGSI